MKQQHKVKSAVRNYILPAPAAKRRARWNAILCLGIAAISILPTTALRAQINEPLIPNGGFETVVPKNGVSSADGWQPFGTGYIVDTSVSRSGTNSIRCDNPVSGTVSGAEYTLTINQTVPQQVVVSGWSKALKVDGEADTDYSVYADITYDDGSHLWGETSNFSTGTHGWERRKLLIIPTSPIQSVNIYALFRSHTGTAWFDDFDAQTSSSDGLFDSQQITPPDLSTSFKSGWFIRDTGVNSPLVPLNESAAKDGISTELQALPTNRWMTVGLKNMTTHDKFVTVYYLERFNGAQPVWWDDIRNSRSATSGEYDNVIQVSVGATGTMSLYPFGCVTGSDQGEALAVPPQIGPRIDRIIYNSNLHLLYAAFDLALTGQGDEAKHDRAIVELMKYPVSSEWAFRDAAAEYYAAFPDACTVRAHNKGIWMPFTDPSTVAGTADFQFGYHEGDNSVPYDRSHGIASFRYIEPMSFWMGMAPSVPRTYAAAIAELKQLAARSPDPKTRQQAEAVLTSGSEDRAGLYNISFRNTPWCDGAVFTLDPNPHISHSSTEWTKALINAAGEPQPGKANQPDSEYLDSLEMMADVLDYRSSDIQASSLPLAYTSDTFMPVVPTWFSVYEEVESLSRSLHAEHKLLMANTVPWRFNAFCHLLDVMGTETSMYNADGSWSPDSDQIMNLRRTMADHKPYLLLLNTDFNKVSGSAMKLYFERCLFYDIYPSMFSADAADQPYWKNPALYNRDRPLFKTYIPLLKQLSAAGWQPVTNAWSSTPSVWIERYGTTLFTVTNGSTSMQSSTITIKTAQPASEDEAIVEELTGDRLQMQPNANSASVSLTLQPSQTAVLRVIHTNQKSKSEVL